MFEYNDYLRPSYNHDYVLTDTLSILNPEKIPDIAMGVIIKLGEADVLEINPNVSNLPVEVFKFLRGYINDTDITKGRVGASLARELYNKYKINLRGKGQEKDKMDKLVSELGTTLASALWTFPAGMRMVFTEGADGRPEEYLHDRSCWFVGTHYHQSRDWLRHNGGGALRFYKDNKLVCRVWHTPTPNGNMVLFNNYGAGFENLSNLTSLVCKTIYPDASCGIIDFKAEDLGKDKVYINKPQSGYIGTGSVPKSLKWFWEEPTEYIYKPWYKCSRCGVLHHDRSDYCNACRR